VKINVKVLEDTSEIILHTNKQNINLITGLGPYTEANISEAITDHEKHLLIINCPSNFKADTEYNISITFIVTLSENISGYYWSSYTFGNETR